MLNNLSAPTIQTNRLFIRIVDLSDSNDYFEFCSNPNVCRYLTFNPYVSLRQSKNAINNMIRAYLQGTDVNFSIINSSISRVIGSISLTFNKDNSATIGYILNENYWNKGYMSEAISAICKVAFSYYKVDCLYAKYIKDNIASEKVLNNNGFTICDVINNGFVKNGRLYDLVVCKKNNDESAT